MSVCYQRFVDIVDLWLLFKVSFFFCENSPDLWAFTLCFNFWSVAFVIILHLTYFFLSMSFLWSLKFCSRTHHDFYIPFQLYFWTLCFLNIFLMNINSFATYECCYPCCQDKSKSGLYYTLDHKTILYTDLCLSYSRG